MIFFVISCKISKSFFPNFGGFDAVNLTKTLIDHLTFRNTFIMDHTLNIEKKVDFWPALALFLVLAHLFTSILMTAVSSPDMNVVLNCLKIIQLYQKESINDEFHAQNICQIKMTYSDKISRFSAFSVILAWFSYNI